MIIILLSFKGDGNYDDIIKAAKESKRVCHSQFIKFIYLSPCLSLSLSFSLACIGKEDRCIC